MQYWKAHYRDALHDADITIRNTEDDYITDPLSFTLDNVTFCGTGLNDFQLADEAQYSAAREKFSLLKWGGYESVFHISQPYVYDLQGYELEVEIPVSVVRKRDERLSTGYLFLSFRHVDFDMSRPHCITMCDEERVYPDDVIVQEFSLSVDGARYQSPQKTLCFEYALIGICRKIKSEYYLKCCFTCQYSDYSPCGNDDYGTMLCYCRNKEDCLKVNNKKDYFTFLEGKDYDARQETYLCEQYCPRNRAGGYRGFVDGVAD